MIMENATRFFTWHCVTMLIKILGVFMLQCVCIQYIIKIEEIIYFILNITELLSGNLIQLLDYVLQKDVVSIVYIHKM